MFTRITRPGATKTERIAARRFFLPKVATMSKVELKDGSATVYLYSQAGRLYAIGFSGNAARPAFHYAYRTEDSRREAVQQFFAGQRARAERKAVIRAQKAAWTNPLKVGDILHTSWGYDQTNVEFFAVTKVSGRRVWVREIAGEYEETGFMSGRTKPALPVRFVGPELMKTAQPSGSSVYVKITSSADAYPVEPGKSYHTSSYA